MVDADAFVFQPHRIGGAGPDAGKAVEAPGRADLVGLPGVGPAAAPDDDPGVPGIRLNRSLGQVSTQMPHPTQASTSITGKRWTMAMALKGQAPAHSPKPTQPHWQSVGPAKAMLAAEQLPYPM